MQTHTENPQLNDDPDGGEFFWPAAEWSERAVCRMADNPNIFFPRTYRQYRWAQAWCSVCPVASECATAAEEEEAAMFGTAHMPLRSVRGHTAPDPDWFVPRKATDRTVYRKFNTETLTGLLPATTRQRGNPGEAWCEYCEKLTDPDNTIVDRTGGRFCSPRCADRAARYTVVTADGDRLGLCTVCYKPQPVDRLGTDGHPGWLCDECHTAYRPGGPSTCRQCGQSFRGLQPTPPDRHGKRFCDTKCRAYHYRRICVDCHTVLGWNSAKHNTDHIEPEASPCDCRCWDCWQAERRRRAKARPPATCDECGEPAADRARTRPAGTAATYCSRTCAAAARKKTYRRTCGDSNCDKTFVSKRADRPIYCSPGCAAANIYRTADTIEKACGHCGRMFEVRADRLRSPRFCSPECGHRSRRKPDRTFQCEGCGKDFTRKPHGNREYKYCSQKCRTVMSRIHQPGPSADRTPTVKTCQGVGCDATFEVWRKNPDRPRKDEQKYCTVVCGKRNRPPTRTPTVKTCMAEDCDATFEVWRKDPDRPGRDERNYCSAVCGKRQAKTRRARRLAAQQSHNPT